MVTWDLLSYVRNSQMREAAKVYHALELRTPCLSYIWTLLSFFQ